MSRQPSPLDFPQSPLSRAFEQPLFLGLFLPVQSGGWSPSALPRSTTWTFDYNRQLTLRASAQNVTGEKARTQVWEYDSAGALKRQEVESRRANRSFLLTLEGKW